MQYFIDFEFMENGITIEPLSIGVVAQDGRELYYEFMEANRDHANDFVREHVLPSLSPRLPYRADSPEFQAWLDGRGTTPLRWKAEIRTALLQFVAPSQYGKPEFWGYYADYDWVALCQIFGTMMDLPEGWPMYCRDLKQWCDQLGNPKLPEQGKGEHHALADARWNREAYAFLQFVAPCAP